MSHAIGRGRRLAVALACCAVPAAARADVDMNGPWLTSFAGVATFVQTGTTLTLSGQPWGGTIDPVSGMFTLNGPNPSGQPCGPAVVTATVDPSGASFTGMLVYFDSVNIGMACQRQNVIPASGSRCGNGVVDPGEQCDSLNPFRPDDCCSSTCQFEPADKACTPGGNVCMLGVCTGASDACVPVGPADGAPCDDALFCNGADTCLGGFCTHAGNPCAGPPGCLACNEGTDQCDALAGT